MDHCFSCENQLYIMDIKTYRKTLMSLDHFVNKHRTAVEKTHTQFYLYVYLI